MYYLVIVKNNYKYDNFHIFSSEENIEKWFDKTYKYKIIPDYKVIEFDEIDPEFGKNFYELYRYD